MKWILGVHYSFSKADYHGRLPSNPPDMTPRPVASASSGSWVEMQTLGLQSCWSEVLVVRPRDPCFVSPVGASVASRSLRTSTLACLYPFIFLLLKVRVENATCLPPESGGIVRLKSVLHKAQSGEYAAVGFTEPWHVGPTQGFSYIIYSEADDLDQLVSHLFFKQ